ncbi:hypothetical protein [Solicola sp. PLA-1-18]|uniref:hypothetical protein n=1 Tax=Solicola sp. PLA-1-18 TaxID=3380532 RepID=UPI003B7E84DB
MPLSRTRLVPAIAAGALIAGGAAVVGPAGLAQAAGSQHRVFASPSACRNILFADAQRLRDAGYTVTVSRCVNQGGRLRTDGYLKWY